MNFARMLHSCASLLLAAVAAASTPASAAPRPNAADMTVPDIQACMRHNLVDRAALRDMAISATDREGKTHSLKVKLYWKPGPKGQARINLRLVEPIAVAGSSYLLLQDGESEEVYFYLPGADKALNLGGQSLSEPMWNTDFSYAEIKQVLGLLASGNTARASDSIVAGRPVFGLQTITLANKAQGSYTRVDSFVDQATCALLRSEFYVKGDQLAKVLEADVSTLLSVDTYSVVLGYTMRSMRGGSKTTVNLSDFTLLERMPETAFDPKHFFEPFE
jgi:hypothetical protein